MMAMQAVMNLQEKLLASLGPTNNPFVKPKNVSNASGGRPLDASEMPVRSVASLSMYSSMLNEDCATKGT